MPIKVKPHKHLYIIKNACINLNTFLLRKHLKFAADKLCETVMEWQNELKIEKNDCCQRVWAYRQIFQIAKENCSENQKAKLVNENNTFIKVAQIRSKAIYCITHTGSTWDTRPQIKLNINKGKDIKTTTLKPKEKKIAGIEIRQLY